MKLQTFTINVRAKEVRPIQVTAQLVGLFGVLREEGLQVQAVFSDSEYLTMSQRYTRLHLVQGPFSEIPS